MQTLQRCWSYELDKPLPKEYSKKVIGLMKEELDGKKKKEFPALREKQYSCLTDNNDEDKKSKIKKKVQNLKIIKFRRNSTWKKINHF